MASTMSVDEYFDELIDKVREDYANVRYTPRHAGWYLITVNGCTSIILKHPSS